jgi:hypothetical protein
MVREVIEASLQAVELSVRFPPLVLTAQERTGGTKMGCSSLFAFL